MRTKSSCKYCFRIDLKVVIVFGVISELMFNCNMEKNSVLHQVYICMQQLLWRSGTVSNSKGNGCGINVLMEKYIIFSEMMRKTKCFDTKFTPLIPVYHVELQEKNMYNYYCTPYLYTLQFTNQLRITLHYYKKQLCI